MAYVHPNPRKKFNRDGKVIGLVFLFALSVVLICVKIGGDTAIMVGISAGATFIGVAMFYGIMSTINLRCPKCGWEIGRHRSGAWKIWAGRKCSKCGYDFDQAEFEQVCGKEPRKKYN